MAKKKTGYGIYVIAAIVLVVAVIIMLYSSGKFGQAVFAKDRTQGWSCYFDYPPGTSREQMKENSCEGWNSRCSGIEKCDANVRKKEGQTFRVTSTCAGTHDVRIDGKHRQLHFQCTPVDVAQVKIQQQSEQCTRYKSTSAELKNKIDKVTQQIQELTRQKTDYESMLAESEQKVATACKLPVCGNNQVELGEECDSADRTKCTAACKQITPVVTLGEDKVWHLYQCVGSVYVNNQNVGPYGTSLTSPPGCGSNAATIDHDLGYLLRQPGTGTGTIKQCQHQYGRYVDGITTETDIKFNANCDYDDRILTTTQTMGPNGVIPSIVGYAFTTQQPGTRQAYKCVKSGTPVRYNYKISFSANCNAGQAGWDGYQNVGTLGWFLIKPELPVGVNIQ